MLGRVNREGCGRRFVKLAWAVMLLAVTAGEAVQAAKREQPADTLVAAALRAEFMPSQQNPAQWLAAAVRRDADHAPALWRQGNVRFDDQWVDYGQVPELLAGKRDLAAYRKKRHAAEETVADQLELANWCRRHRLVDQERAHLWQITLLEPGHRVARERLGHLWVDGKWVDQVELGEQSARANVRAQAYQHWLPELRDIAEGLGHRNRRRREAAAAKLSAIDDPLALSALHEVVAPLSEQHALVVLDFARRAPGEEASLYLAEAALNSENPTFRHVATECLRQRPYEEFIPPLLEILTTPVDFQHELFLNRQGELIYRSYLAREGRTKREFEVRQTRVRRVTLAVGNEPLAVVMALNRVEGQASQAWQDAERLNQEGSARNEAIVALLAEVTEEPLPPDAKAWWKWWAGYLEILETREKDVVTHFTSQEMIITDRDLAVARGSSCFTAGTPVWTERGALPIEQVSPGDLVLAKNERTGEVGYKPVLQTTVRPPENIYKLRIGSEEFACTAGHLFWVSGQGWKMAKHLAKDDPIHAVRGVENVQAVENTDRQEATYNLLVADWHSYFVGENLVLSHDVTEKQPTLAVVPGLLQTKLARVY